MNLLHAYKPLDELIQTQAQQTSWFLGGCQYVYIKNRPPLQSGDWVALYEPPSPYAHDHGLLLCELADDRWLLWVPDHGAVELCLRQVCPIGNPSQPF
jgi:hypothetical protein